MIHQYKLGGYNIILDVGSGSVHVVDELVYDIVEAYGEADKDALAGRLLEKYKTSGLTRAEFEEAFDDIEALREAGKLFASDDFGGVAHDFRNNKEIKALCLHVAHACNLTCDYCFAGAGRYQGPSALMSFETGRRAIDFLAENSGTRRNLEVDFFGGEPLRNWDVVKRLVGYARGIERERGKNFRFTLTTNGVLVDDDVIDFSNREMTNVVMSLDGRKQVHDRLRKTPEGGAATISSSRNSSASPRRAQQGNTTSAARSRAITRISRTIFFIWPSWLYGTFDGAGRLR
jgi:uncharacterized protein